MAEFFKNYTPLSLYTFYFNNGTIIFIFFL